MRDEKNKVFSFCEMARDSMDVLPVGNLNLLGRQVFVKRIHRQEDNPWDVQIFDNPLSNTGLPTGTCT